MLFHDRALIDGPARITREGHFVARARVARANNVQDYSPRELRLPPKPDGSMYRIFRPEAEIFAKDSLASALHKTVVIDHPSEDVDATNWKSLSVGDTGGDILRDGEFMSVPVMVMDAKGVKAVQTTHPEFSWGYSADVVLTPGKFGDQEYDGSVKGVRYNHLAMCPHARGGIDLRVTDSLVIIDERPAHLRDSQQEPTMKIKIGDAEVDATNGEAVKIAVDVLNNKLGDATGQIAGLAGKLTDAEGKVASLTAENVALETKVADATLTPEKLRDAARNYAIAIGKAKALGVAVTDSMGETEIVRAVVDAKVKPELRKGWNDAQYASAFVPLTVDIKIADAGIALHDAISGTPVNIGDARTEYEASRDKHKSEIRDAWRKPALAVDNAA